MINELHQLSFALQNTGIVADAWHRRYGPIARITSTAPCLRIVLNGSSVAEIESVSADKGSNIRRYGDNQASFPALNLAALYRITDNNIRMEIERLIKDGGEYDVDTIESWCHTDNWSKNFREKYKRSFEARPQEIKQILQGETQYQPFNDLMNAVQPFTDPNTFREALKEEAFKMLRARRGITVALQTLFFLPSQKEEEQEASGKLSVVLDTYDLEYEGASTIGPRFAKDLNKALLSAEHLDQNDKTAEAKDAFGQSFIPLEEPMPKVKLAAGFDVSLRTMFKGQPCQNRYGKFENDSYPISKKERTELSAALEWIGKQEHANKTWVSIGKGEAMFVFPSRISKQLPGLTGLYQSDPLQKEALFEAKAKSFADYVTKTKEYDPENVPEWIQFFILKKVDKARTRVVYSYNAKPEEIIQRSDDWQSASKNLPGFHFGTPQTPFPLKIAGILNKVWKQDGTVASGKYKEVTAYFGMELFFGRADLNHTLRVLIKNAAPLTVFAGSRPNASQSSDRKGQFFFLKETLVLMGMLLYWKKIRKDAYMNEYPYLFGQLLKAADGLHELYCMTERKGQLPPQLVGSSMYQAAMEFPSRTLAQLAQRLLPYLGWAKTHKDDCFSITTKNGELVNSPPAGYYLSVLHDIAGKLANALTNQTRFSDTEKAQLLIGYLASFPKKEKSSIAADQTETMNLKGDSSNEA